MEHARGYIFSCPFRGQRIPQRVQNIVINDYCVRNNFQFVVSRAEYVFHHEGSQLRACMEENINHVVFYSLLQMPSRSETKQLLYNAVASGAKNIHFAVESIRLANIEDCNLVELILSLINAESNRKDKGYLMWLGKVLY